MSTQITIAVQIDGRTRGTVSVANRAARNEDRVMKVVRGDSVLSAALPGTIGRVVFVPGRLIGIFSEGYVAPDHDTLYQSFWSRLKRGQWHHIESVTEGGKDTVYVDGVLQEPAP